MPERIFKYNTVAELKSYAKNIAAALTSGSITALRDSSAGWLVESGPISQADLRNRMLDVRYEIFLRGRGNPVDGAGADSVCAALEPTDPRRERIMRVETIRGGYGGFAWLPNTY